MHGQVDDAARWDQLYREGYGGAYYPWDAVVSFVRRYAPTERPPADVSILDIGCGTGANLWFCAREGFAVEGVDGSQSALARAKAWLATHGLSVPLHHGLIGAPLPFSNDRFDLAIDRAAITCNPPETMRDALIELARVMRPGGALFSLVYTGACVGVCCGSSHYTLDALRALFSPPHWTIVSAVELTRRQLVDAADSECSELMIVARKSGCDPAPLGR